MTSYSEIYDLTLAQLDDPLLAQWPEEDLERELYSWMIRAIHKLPNLRSELSERNDEEQSFNIDLSDTTKAIISMAMSREWLGKQIKSITHTLQGFSKKEAYSQAEHLKSLQALDKDILIEFNKLYCLNTYVDNEYFN